MIIEQVRSGRVEARHPVRRWDAEPAHACYARSSLKPVQARPFAAIANKLGLGPKHIAVACGSHNGERPHIEAVQDILDAAGLDASALRCGIHPVPGLTREQATLIHNNCSGKHAAMLAVCVDEGWSLDYLRPEHPLQQRIKADIERITPAPAGVDGCGLPTPWLTLRALANLFEDLAKRDAHILSAMHAHPFMVAGTDRVDTAVMERAPVVTKIGAMGVMAGVHLETGDAFALHVESGDERARDAAGIAVMGQLGWLEPEALMPYAAPRIRNHAGHDVGAYRAV